MAKIYVAASASRQLDARVVARMLTGMGHEVCSSWLWAGGVGYGPGGPNVESHGRAAEGDLMDVLRSDAVVVITGDVETRGGRHSEVGIALAWKKPVYVLGPREQVFHCGQGVTVIEDVCEIGKVVEGVGDKCVQMWKRIDDAGYVGMSFRREYGSIVCDVVVDGFGAAQVVEEGMRGLKDSECIAAAEFLGTGSTRWAWIVRAVAYLKKMVK